MKKTILISPHDDDSALFCAFTCLREKPLIVVVTDAYIQDNRGEKGCDAITRARESEEAHKILGCETLRLGIRDDEINEEIVEIMFKTLEADKVYAPALQGGNPHHDTISRIAKKVFGDKVIFYTTYTPTELWTKGDIEVIPTQRELNLKNRALTCYHSQINLPATRPHFLAILGRSEFLI